MINLYYFYLFFIHFQGKRFLHLIVEKNKIDSISGFPITADLDTLLFEENGKVKFYFSSSFFRISLIYDILEIINFLKICKLSSINMSIFYH